MQNAQAPREVQESFDDVIRAREDEQREKNQAETYANGVIPEARGQAQRLYASDQPGDRGLDCRNLSLRICERGSGRQAGKYCST